MDSDEVTEERMVLEAIYADAFSENTLELPEFTLSWILPKDYPASPPSFTLSLASPDDEIYKNLLSHIDTFASDCLG
jgi:hypothetical protein